MLHARECLKVKTWGWRVVAPFSHTSGLRLLADCGVGSCTSDLNLSRHLHQHHLAPPKPAMASLPDPPPQWVLDTNSTPPSKPKPGTFADPPGYTTASQQLSRNKSAKTVTPRKPPSAEDMDVLKLKKAWELALAPAKQLPMNAIGMYMTGNSLQIFSIMMVFMLFKAPIQALLNVQQTFARLETDGNRSSMVVVKLAFVACNFLALGLGIWKVNGMGLLPYVFVSSCARATNTDNFREQDDKIRLASVGDGERSDRNRLLCTVMMRQRTQSKRASRESFGQIIAHDELLSIRISPPPTIQYPSCGSLTHTFRARRSHKTQREGKG